MADDDQDQPREVAAVAGADGFQLSTLGGDHDGGCAALDVEDGAESVADDGQVGFGDAEGGGGEGDLGDEVTDLGVREVHESGGVSGSAIEVSGRKPTCGLRIGRLRRRKQGNLQYPS